MLEGTAVLTSAYVPSTDNLVLVMAARDLAARAARGSREYIRIDDPEPRFEWERRVEQDSS